MDVLVESALAPLRQQFARRRAARALCEKLPVAEIGLIVLGGGDAPVSES